MLFQRMIRAARLDPDVFYDLERDRTANGQSFLVVIIIAGCTLLGAITPGLLSFFGVNLGVTAFSGWILLRVLFQIVVNMIGGWLFWTAVAAVIGMRYGGRGDFEGVMRAVGFAYSPGVLYLFAFVPGLGRVLRLVVGIWIVIGMVIAVRESLHFDTRKAVLTSAITTGILLVIGYFIGMPLGLPVYLLSW
jgi:hypothetical protein